VNHTASARFWRCYEALSVEVRVLADKNFDLLKQELCHPSLPFKAIGGGKLRSARVDLHHRALGLRTDDGVHRFWIGTHAQYDRLVEAGSGHR
jgi:hypothetical protein